MCAQDAAPATTPLKCFWVSDDGDHHDVVFERHAITAKRRFADELGYHLSDITCRRMPAWDHFAAQGYVPALARIDAGWRYECMGCGTDIDDAFIGTRARSEDGYEEWLLDREYGPDLTRAVMAPIEPKPEHVWCCQQCYDDDMRARAKRRRWEERVHAWLVRRLRRRLPDAVPHPLPDAAPGDCSVWGRGEDQSYVYVRAGKLVYHRDRHLRDLQSHWIRSHEVKEARLGFTWPGAQYGPAMFRIVDNRPIGKKRSAQFYVANGDREAFEAWADAQRQLAAINGGA